MMKHKTIAMLALQQRRQRTSGENQLCNYSGRACMQNRMDGYDYCVRHILEDKTAPFKQCFFMSAKTSRRCTKIARTDKKDSYCVEHARKSMTIRPRLSRHQGPRATPEALLEDLEQRHGSKSLDDTPRPVMMSKPIGLQDFLSEEESDDESRPLEKTLKVDPESDDESIDSEQEDILKHAGVYTAEEVALITREKLIRLQSLYIDQFKRLQHVLREKRRKYLLNVRTDKDSACMSSVKNDPSQKQQYDKLVALKRYHKSHGVEKTLHRRSKERRLARAEGARQKEKPHICTYTDDDHVKCVRTCLPFSKYCTNHILNDPSQVLFSSCRFGEGACSRPVPLAPWLATKEGAMEPVCRLHVPLSEHVPRFVEEQAVDESAALDVSEAQALATLASTLGDELETPEASNTQSLAAMEHDGEAGLDESLLCLDPDAVPTLEEAMMDTGLDTNSEDLVMMLS